MVAFSYLLPSLSALWLAAPAVTEDFAIASVTPPRITFEVHHPLKHLTGESHTAFGAARMLEDGTIQAELRVNYGSFQTGNPWVDRVVSETLWTAGDDTIGVKALIAPSALPPPPPPVEATDAPVADDGSVQFEGTLTEKVDTHMQVTLHGVSRVLPVELWLTRSNHSAYVTGNLTVDLNDFGVALPRYFFLPADPKVAVAFEVHWQTAPKDLAPAVADTGAPALQ